MDRSERSNKQINNYKLLKASALLSVINTSRQKISKNIDDLDNTIKQSDQIDIFQVHMEYSSGKTTFWNIQKNLTYKKTLKNKIHKNTFLNHNEIKLEIKNIKICVISSNIYL